MYSIDKKRKETRDYNKILHYTSIVTMPNIFLFNLYNQNHSHIQLNHVVILAIILALVSALGRGVVRLLTRSDEGSIFCLLLLWIIFWFFESIRARLPINSSVVFLAGTAIVLFCVVMLLRFLSGKLQKRRIIFATVSGISILLFVLNAFPAVIPALGESTSSDSENNWQIRKYFDVDITSPHPDIYWLHMDGMLSLKSVEYYFNEPQDELRERLIDLGFVINEDAELYADLTARAVPALLSPDFYDSYLHELFAEGRYLLRNDRTTLYTEAIFRDGISFANDIAPYHELFRSFLQVGYTATMVAMLEPSMFTVIDQFYRLTSNNYTIDLFSNEDGISERHFLIDAIYLIELLSLMTPVPSRFVSAIEHRNIEWQAIPDYESRIDSLTTTTLNLSHERQIYRALIDLFKSINPNPSLAYVTLNFTHAWVWGWQIDSDRDGYYATNLDLYPIAYNYSAYVMLNVIDMILERNQDAIIIIQADHGLHLPDTQMALLEEELTEEDVLHLYNSVISAVRIPERYGGLDAPLAPLNITRELINRFIGDNYQLLDES